MSNAKRHSMRNETIVNWSDRWSRLSSSGPFAERLVGRVVVLPVFTLLALCIYAMLHRRVWHLLRLLRRALCTRTRNFKGAPGGDAAAANSGTVVLPSRHPRYIASMAALRKNGLETYDIAHHPSFSAAFVASGASSAPQNELVCRDSALDEAREAIRMGRVQALGPAMC